MSRPDPDRAGTASPVIGAGEIILIEDTTGKGHLSQGLGQLRRVPFIPVE